MPRGGLVLLGVWTVASWIHTQARWWHLQGGGRRCLPQQLPGSVRSEQPGSSRRTTGHQGCGSWASRCSRGNGARWAMSRPWPSPDGYWGEVELGLPRQDRGNYPGLRAHRCYQQPVSWGWSGLSLTRGTRLRGSVLCRGPTAREAGFRVQTWASVPTRGSVQGSLLTGAFWARESQAQGWRPGGEKTAWGRRALGGAGAVQHVGRPTAMAQRGKSTAAPAEVVDFGPSARFTHTPRWVNRSSRVPCPHPCREEAASEAGGCSGEWGPPSLGGPVDTDTAGLTSPTFSRDSASGFLCETFHTKRGQRMCVQGPCRRRSTCACVLACAMSVWWPGSRRHLERTAPWTWGSLPGRAGARSPPSSCVVRASPSPCARVPRLEAGVMASSSGGCKDSARPGHGTWHS